MKDRNEFTLAKSVAGHDKGSWYAVVRREGDRVYIADGRRRKLGSLKGKNLKHVELTKTSITLEHYTDKSLRRALWEYNFGEIATERGEDSG
ncbi:MAG: KOW domain-containing RNA-binding protein [Oscillospiraceae bacterium]|nr:KOW domain-containing RNA-binding protein [Oscillospiraceae bacterium]